MFTQIVYWNLDANKSTTDFVFRRFHRQSQFGENGNRRFRGKLLVVAVLTRNRWRVKTSTVFISLPRSIQEAQHPMAKKIALYFLKILIPVIEINTVANDYANRAVNNIIPLEQSGFRKKLEALHRS